ELVTLSWLLTCLRQGHSTPSVFIEWDLYYQNGLCGSNLRTCVRKRSHNVDHFFPDELVILPAKRAAIIILNFLTASALIHRFLECLVTANRMFEYGQTKLFEEFPGLSAIGLRRRRNSGQQNTVSVGADSIERLHGQLKRLDRQWIWSTGNDQEVTAQS